LNHIALPTADPERGARFYRDVLGFTETPRPAFSFGGAWLLKREVGVMIHLIHNESFEPTPKKAINSRTNHIAMQVEDFDAAVALLTKHGVEHVVRVLATYNYRQVFFHDPDGNTLELGEWPSPKKMFPELST
jgi:catechol 2,3-dioxygenase-like lactoylglutathione lyase family enzyme